MEKANDEIDLLILSKTVWLQKSKLIAISSIFIFAGIFIAIVTPAQFTASSTFIPQTSEGGNGGGSLGGIAALAGISLGGMSSSDEISPNLYPKIVESEKFKSMLTKVMVKVPNASSDVTYSEYYQNYWKPSFGDLIKDYTLELPGKLIGLIKSDRQDSTIQGLDIGIKQFSLIDQEDFERISEQLSVNPDKKEGFVELNFTMNDPVIAAQMAFSAKALLQEEIIRFKIQNSKEQLSFIQERLEERKLEFELIQGKLAKYRDSNQNITSALAKNNLEELQAEYNLSLEVYTELLKQLEQAKLQVSRDTPIFMTIRPVAIPNIKASPNRFLIVLTCAFLGLFFSLGIIFGSQFFINLKERWHQES